MRIGPRPCTALRRSYRQPDASRGRKNGAGVEATLHSRHLSRGRHAGGQARACGRDPDLDSVVSEISQRVRLLDGLVRYRFGGNAELMGAWASARNVEGPFRSRGQPAA